jgi:hypothetical protein
MKSISVLLLWLVALALAGPLAPFRPECGMACCVSAAAHRASCASMTACSVAKCSKGGAVASLPSLPLSTLPVTPRLSPLAASEGLAEIPPAQARKIPGALPEHPPRA